MKKVALVFSLGVLKYTSTLWLSHNMDILGTLPDGSDVEIFALIIANEISAELMECGAIIRSVQVSYHYGYVGDLVLVRDDFVGYLSNETHFGTNVDR